MNQELLAAVQEGRVWLDKFHRLTYRKVFEAYRLRFAPLYEAAVAETGGDEAALQALAEELMDGIEDGWKRQRPWNRGAIRVDEKQVIVNFLSPMLLRKEGDCARLAELLRDVWNTRRPKDTYRIATYEKITKGFRNSILGIDLNNRHMEEGVDDD